MIRTIICLCCCLVLQAEVTVRQASDGWRLLVDGQPMMIKGMNWGYVPVGTNYSYDLWAQPRPFIEAVLEREMGLLRAMGCNTIRQGTGIPPEWVAYIHRRFGIYTVLNHFTGRYGYQVGGAWRNPFDYSDAASRAAVRRDIEAMVRRYQDVPGILCWALGNENNYGLEWNGFEIQNLPAGERNRARAVHLYRFWEELAQAIKAIDTTHPVTISNGDLQYLDLIAEHCRSVDIIGCNVYRGVDFSDLFSRVRSEVGKPVLFTEFGCDRYHAAEQREAAVEQATYLRSQWRHIYASAAGFGGDGNALGGMVFQWSDGWWKIGQNHGLDQQSTQATWGNGGYRFDAAAGNNMNEEWFGICAKEPAPAGQVYPLHPRNAWLTLAEIWQLDPYRGNGLQTRMLAQIERATVDRPPSAAELQRQPSDQASGQQTTRRPVADPAPTVERQPLFKRSGQEPAMVAGTDESRWESALQEAIARHLRPGREPDIELHLGRKQLQARLMGIDARGTLRLRLVSDRSEMQLPWRLVNIEAKADAAAGLCRGLSDVPELQALAAFYALRAQRTNQAFDHLAMAGRAGDPVRQAFGLLAD